ncbi:hypothetical protein MC885_000938 [Smutsia gigantea]|nr:hypothetical protein MC885_000938 [Smutsia gigantea]
MGLFLCEVPGPLSYTAIALFCLEQRIWAQSGQYPQPSIWASPGTLVPQGNPVTIHCRGPPGVSTWRLLKAGPDLAWQDMNSHGAQGAHSLFIQSVTHFSAGTYFCRYLKRGIWSELSGPLDLVVTGVFEDRPSLTALPGPNVTSGGNVTLLCQASFSYSLFNLSKDEKIAPPQDFFHQDHRTFLISPVTLAHRGTYRCFGSWQRSPHKWSKPSNPIMLLVTDERSGQTDPHASENGYLPVVIGIPAAAVLLLFFLLFVLCRCWHRPEHSISSPVMDFQEESQYVMEDIQPEEDREMGMQTPAEEDLQEVTYAKLHLETLLGSGDPRPSCTMEASSTQPCVYAVLSLSEGRAGPGCVDLCHSAP